MQHTGNVISVFTRHPWLVLSLAHSLSPAQWLDILNTLEISAEALVQQSLENALPAIPQADVICRAIKRVSTVELEQSLAWQAADEHHHIITIECKSYPTLLRQLTSPPLVLFVAGAPACLYEQGVAIVGSRRASHYGVDNAQFFARELSARGMAIVSGMATGIDGAAHVGTLKNGGATVAVLGSGIDVVYPKRHARLYDEIKASNGAVISEFAPGTPVRREQFPRRNRIIAAITSGTLVVEAAIKSGTLITANMAINMGRDVFAVPGNIHSPLTQGCHLLIQQGAKLVVCAQDILDELSMFSYTSDQAGLDFSKKSHGICLATDKLLDSVDYDITSVNIIAERNNLPVQAVMASLLEYELRGLVASVPGGYIKLRGK